MQGPNSDSKAIVSSIVISPVIHQYYKKTLVMSRFIYYIVKIKLNFLSIQQGKKILDISATFLWFLGDLTFPPTVAGPKMLLKGLSRCAKLTKSLGGTEKQFSSFLCLALSQSLFFTKDLLILSKLKNVPTHRNSHSFLSTMAAVSVLNLPEEPNK